MNAITFSTIALCTLLYQVSGHGRLMDPPGRSSAWRYGFQTPRNFDDNALYCGGFATKLKNSGKCGVCGDPWDGARDNEAGGKYATGTIVRRYKIGQTINIKVELTVNHWGWMEFRICPNNDVTKPVTHDCLNRHVLQRADGNGTKIQIDGSRMGILSMDFKLPDGMTCSQCVLQWKYKTGNTWGIDKETGTGCVGCGDQQEFYGCSDVSISGNDEVHQQITTRLTDPPADTQPNVFIGMKLPCKGINNWANDPGMDKWCTDNCATGNCPAYGCDCSGSLQGITDTRTSTSRPTATPTRFAAPTTTTTPGPPAIDSLECKAIGLWAGNDYLDRWCTDHCHQTNCPPDECKCTVVQKAVTPSTTTVQLSKSTVPVDPRKKVCHAISIWQGIQVFDAWCTDECNNRNCPEDTCQCTETTEHLKTTTAKPTAKTPAVTSHGKCSSSGVVAGDYYDGWCQKNCDRGFCETDYCLCNV